MKRILITGKTSWIGNELECTRYKAMYLAGAADYEKISK